MRIVHFTSVHVWDDNRILNKMCRTLASQGNDVHLVATMPIEQDESVVDGVMLHAVSRPRNRLERFMKTTPDVLRKANLIDAELYHFHDPEFLPYIRKNRNVICKPLIFDVHEDYPAAILSKTWLPRLFRPLISRIYSTLELKSVMCIDGIIVAWPKILDRFKQHPHRLLINNYPYRDELNCVGEIGKERRSGWFAYVGVLSPMRGILEMIRAIEKGGRKFRLILGGNWSSEEYRRKCQAEQGWSECEYWGYLSRKEMRDLFAIVQAGIIAFFPEPNHLYSMPNKIFEYMSASLPVIASDLPMQRLIVEEAGCGVVADATSSDSIYEKMQWLFEHPTEAATMGHAGRHAIETKMNWETEAKRLLHFYNQVLANN